MSKTTFTKTIYRFKKNLRNKVRTGMRKAVNFALANEPDIYEAEEDDEKVEVDETEIGDSVTSKPKKKSFVSTALKVVAITAACLLIFKFGKKKGLIAGARKWDSFFNKLAFSGGTIMHNTVNGMRMKVTSEIL